MTYDDESVTDAVVNVYAPSAPVDDEYFQKSWSKPLFKALLSVDIDTDENILKIRLESTADGSIIAIAPFDGESGIETVSDSTSHYVLTIRKENLKADIGIKFIDRSDSIDFSLVTQKFVRKKMAEERYDSPEWSERRLGRTQINDELESRVSDSPVPLLQPPPSTTVEVNDIECDSSSNGHTLDESSDDSEFGEFQ